MEDKTGEFIAAIFLAIICGIISVCLYLFEINNFFALIAGILSIVYITQSFQMNAEAQIPVTSREIPSLIDSNSGSRRRRNWCRCPAEAN